MSSPDKTKFHQKASSFLNELSSLKTTTNKGMGKIAQEIQNNNRAIEGVSKKVVIEFNKLNKLIKNNTVEIATERIRIDKIEDFLKTIQQQSTQKTT